MNMASTGVWSNDVPPPEALLPLSPPCRQFDWQGLNFLRCGLANLGNTCFINSILQALFHVPAFMKQFGSKSNHGMCGRSCIICQLYSTLCSMTVANSYRPVLLIATLKLHLPNLVTGAQEDAHEFVTKFLQLLDDEFLKQFSPRVEYIRSLTSPISRIFTGWLKTQCICPRTDCGFISETYSAFTEIEVVPSRSARSLQELITQQYLPERGIGMKCSACGNEVLCTRQYSIHQYPAVLLVEIKRFRLNNSGKDLRAVNITKEFELPGNIKYNLCSVVIHRGTTQEVGHYVTAAQDPHNGFCLFDDSKVSSYSIDSHEVKTGSYIILSTMAKTNEPIMESPHIEEPKIGTKSFKRRSSQPIRSSPSKRIIKRTAGTEPKTHSNKSSHDHNVMIETNVMPGGPIRSTPSKLIIKRTARAEPKTHSSQSSHDYNLIKETNVISSGPIKSTPIKMTIKRTARTEPKTHSSQSSHDYNLIKETNVISSGPLKSTPIKMIIKRTARTEPKTHSSQSSHDYNVIKETNGPRCTPLNIISSQFLPQVTSSQAADQLSHVRQLSFQTVDVPHDIQLTQEDVPGSELPLHSPIPTQDIQLTQEDVPGSKLPLENIAANKVKHLKRFLKCRGIPTKGKKAALVSRVKGYQLCKTVDILDPAIDDGFWYNKKRTQLSQTIQGFSQVSQAVSTFPTDGWDNFPSHDIPLNFNFGRIYDYLVESAPQYDPTSGVKETNVESEEDIEHDLSVHDIDVRHHWKRVNAEDGSDNEPEDPFDAERGFLNDVKQLRQGFRFLKSKHARNVRDNVQGSIYFLRCDMKASMTKKVYYVKIAISTLSGNIKLAQCTCKARTLERCGHISGLLLYAWCHVRLNGYGAVTCTSRPCQWNKGALKRNPGPINTNKYESCKMDIERRSRFDTRPTAHQVSIASKEQIDSFIASLSGNSYKTLWQIHRPIVYNDYSIESLTRLDHLKLAFMKLMFLHNLKIIPKRLVPIDPNHGQGVFELIGTAGQGNNPTWLAARSIRVTASVAHKVLHFTTEEAVRSFLKEHLWMISNEESIGREKSKYIKYGHQYESSAMTAYQKYRSVFDSTVFVHNTFGLLMREDFPELGCSPDGMAFSEYRKPRLIEVKCPYILRNHHPKDFDKVLTSKQKYNFCLKRNTEGNIVLKENHIYYSQIQLSLGIVGLDKADLVVYSKQGFIVLTIKFNSYWWEQNVPSLKDFHHSTLVPEYFLQRTPRNLVPFQIWQ